MGVLSEKMKKAGWPLVREKNGSWTVHASGARVYTYDALAGWSVSEKEILAALDGDLDEIRRGERDPVRTLSKTTALDHTRNPSQPVSRICQAGKVLGKNVLHLGTGLDKFARDAMLAAGALLVADYDPNFYPDRSVLQRTYDVVVCNYVLNILPPHERRLAYADIAACTHPQGSAYLCVQGKWPVVNRHRVVGEFADGYVILDSPSPTFRKGYDPQEFVEEIQRILGGKAEIECMFYSNTLAVWKP